MMASKEMTEEKTLWMASTPAFSGWVLDATIVTEIFTEVAVAIVSAVSKVGREPRAPGPEVEHIRADHIHHSL